MLRFFSLDEAAAAEDAGIDIASVPADVLFHPEYRTVAPTIFSMAGQTHTECVSPSEYLKWCNSAIEKGAGAGCDAQYLYSNDILGYTDGHIPRHAKVYRDFKGEFARPQN